MRLTTGIPAPPFSGTAFDGTSLSVEAFQGRKLYMILARFVSCPFCSLRLEAISRYHGHFEGAGIAVLVVFPSAKKRVQKYVEKYGPDFLVMADPDQEVFRAFGSETSWTGEIRSIAKVGSVFEALSQAKMNPFAIDDAPHRMPSEYLINENGMIDSVRYGEVLNDGFTVDEVLEWANK